MQGCFVFLIIFTVVVVAAGDSSIVSPACSNNTKHLDYRVLERCLLWSCDVAWTVESVCGWRIRRNQGKDHLSDGKCSGHLSIL